MKIWPRLKKMFRSEYNDYDWGKWHKSFRKGYPIRQIGICHRRYHTVCIPIPVNVHGKIAPGYFLPSCPDCYPEPNRYLISSVNRG